MTLLLHYRHYEFIAQGFSILFNSIASQGNNSFSELNYEMLLLLCTFGFMQGEEVSLILTFGKYLSK